MGIFKKASESDKKLTKEDVIKAIEAMSDDEQSDLYDELLARAKSAGDDETADKGESETEKQIEKAEEDIAEKGADSQTEKDRIDESVGEQEKQDGNEDSQDAKDRVDESLGEKKYVERKDYEALLARVSALEEKANGKDKLPKPKEVDKDDFDEEDNDFFK